MTSTLPVEIWQLILEHALIFHLFFSTDPVADSTENCGDYNAAIHDWLKAPGWEEEFRRQRLVLRQVCHSWRTFVDRPEIKLRFGRMEDVLFSNGLSIRELMQARRIKAPEATYVQLSAAVLRKMIGLAQTLPEARDEGDADFKVEIVTNLTLHLSKQILESDSSMFPHLKSLHLGLTKTHVPFGWVDDGLAKISKHFPAMVFLYLNVNASTFPRKDNLRLQSLTTLVIMSSRSPLAPLFFDQWSLPSLRHLKVGLFRDVAELRSLCGALPQLGRRLKVLDIEVETVDEDIDDVMPHLWSDCPRLESLHFPLSLLIAHPPTNNRHPLRYLINTEHDYRGSCYKVNGWIPANFTSTVISFFNALPNLLVVRDSHDWTSIGFRELENSNEEEDNFSMKFDQETCRQMVETAVRIKALNMAVRFEDEKGKTWEET